MKKEKKIQLETFSVIILVTLILTVGIMIFNTLTTRRKVENFEKESELVIGAAKNAYIAFSKEELPNYLATSTDGTTKAMCITLKGLEKNNLLTQDLSKWDGYVVIEMGEKTTYKIWLTDKKYIIKGIEESDIKNLKINKTLEKYDKEELSDDVKNSFSSTKRYESKCINEKIE